MKKYISNIWTGLKNRYRYHKEIISAGIGILTGTFTLGLIYIYNSPRYYEPVCVQQIVERLDEHKQTVPYSRIKDVCDNDCSMKALDDLLNDYNMDPASAIDYALQKCEK